MEADAGDGEFNTIAERAEYEAIAPSYTTRVLRITLLAPVIVEVILDGKQGPEVMLPRVLEPFPAEWQQQPGYDATDRTPTAEDGR